MKILVLGGTRFIGRSIVERLLREGHSVTLLNRGVSTDPFGTRVRRLLGDRREPGFVKRAAASRDYDAVVDVSALREEDTASAIAAFTSLKASGVVMTSMLPSSLVTTSSAPASSAASMMASSSAPAG